MKTNLELLKEELADALGYDLAQKDQGRCVKCREPFVRGKNVFTDAGERETRLSGLCEACFDAMFAE